MEYGLIGERLAHSYSADIHGMVGGYSYELHEIAPRDLDGFLRARDFKGINVTIPYKRACMDKLDWISDEAKRIGAVNTIVNDNGRLRGYNTDICGFKSLLNAQGVDLRGKKVLVLGTGGTSRTASAALKDIGAALVLRVSRSPDANESDVIGYGETEGIGAQHIVNTTPVGMFPNSDIMPIDLRNYSDVKGITDVIYNPLFTPLVQLGMKMGMNCAGGLRMLVAQAVCASRLFGRASADRDAIDRITHGIIRKKMNIVLIGMPSCGKTTIGRILAKSMSRRFVDTDALVGEMTGMDASEFIRKRGEKAFREAESKAVESLSGKTGLVISTGGGTPLDPDNVMRLKRDAAIFWIDRPLELLSASPSRPLSSTAQDLARIFAERRSAYAGSCDARVANEADAPACVKAIERNFNDAVSRH